MKKTFAMFMACAMTAAALAGCSAASTKEASTEAVTSVETTVGTAGETSSEPPADTPAETAGGTASSTEDGQDDADSVTLRIGSLKGPTSMGLVYLMDQASKNQSKGSYEFTMVTDASELSARMAAGDLDIALVPANLASILYQKTNHGINVLDINTLGVLYVVSADASISTITDLKGKTIYMTGKGTTPDYVLNYLLTANGLAPGDVTIEYKSEAAEVAAVLKEQSEAIGLLPQPFVTAAMAQNESLHMVLDLTAQWDQVQEGTESPSRLVTGVTVCRSQLFSDDAYADAVKVFMEEHAESAQYANSHIEETAQLIADAGIIEKVPIAQKALPYCSIVYIDGNEMKDLLHGYLTVLYEQEPSSVGGQLPDKPFYYIP